MVTTLILKTFATENFNSSHRWLGSDATSLFPAVQVTDSLSVNRPFLLLNQLTADFTRWILHLITVSQPLLMSKQMTKDRSFYISGSLILFSTNFMSRL
jgi:hypothetical protein